jgi:hypothetical protein
LFVLFVFFPAGKLDIDNEPSTQRLATVATNYALAGAHMVAPSDMMDGYGTKKNKKKKKKKKKKPDDASLESVVQNSALTLTRAAAFSLSKRSSAK